MTYSITFLTSPETAISVYNFNELRSTTHKFQRQHLIAASVTWQHTSCTNMSLAVTVIDNARNLVNSSSFQPGNTQSNHQLVITYLTFILGWTT